VRGEGLDFSGIGPAWGFSDYARDPKILSGGRCQAAIHHGGVGTTVGVLMSGLPQVVVPRGFDQPQTAQRITRLGVARTLPWRRESTTHLTRELNALLSDHRYRRNALAVQARLIGEHGLSETVRMVDVILRS
jgi:UDP:flavonoid glycosyltransferase YjiC (YdhE family)